VFLLPELRALESSPRRAGSRTANLTPLVSQTEEQQIQMAIRDLSEIKLERMLHAARISELANKAHFFVKQSQTKKAKLLNLLLSNCKIDAASIYPTYRKPFNIILARANNKEWRARGDLNSQPSGSMLKGIKIQIARLVSITFLETLSNLSC
jgi:hypothetical protein